MGLILGLLFYSRKVVTSQEQLRGRPVAPSRFDEVVHNLRKAEASQPV